LFKESLSALAAWAAGAALMLALHRFTHWRVFIVLGAVFGLLLLFTLYFFRDPERAVPEGAGRIVSPADGRIVDISECEEPSFIGGKAVRVAIFLSVWDVHVNRIPIDGRVTHLEYRKGEFRKAFEAEASEVNERMEIGIESPYGRFLVRQIAGILARRIVCRVRKGDAVERGARFGMIKFGSRTELFLPAGTRLRVKTGERVKGGETIIGEFLNAS
jgi:phosphatidylserine decarboxylase